MISKLKIGVFEDSDFSVKKNTITLQINPEDYKEDKTVVFAEDNAVTPIFQDIGRDTLKLDFILDGTGVIPPGNDKKPTVVSEKIKEIEEYLYLPYLKKVGSGYERRTHFAQVRWGELFFEGCLKSMQVHYTLFRPNGEPLRAKVSLEFIRAKKPFKETVETKKDELDEDLNVKVREGDTLPFLCAKYYNDSTLDQKIARKNGLANIKELKPGTTLKFPHLDQLN